MARALANVGAVYIIPPYLGNTLRRSTAPGRAHGEPNEVPVPVCRCSIMCNRGVAIRHP